MDYPDVQSNPKHRTHNYAVLLQLVWCGVLLDICHKQRK